MKTKIKFSNYDLKILIYPMIDSWCILQHLPCTCIAQDLSAGNAKSVKCTRMSTITPIFITTKFTEKTTYSIRAKGKLALTVYEIS